MFRSFEMLFFLKPENEFLSSFSFLIFERKKSKVKNYLFQCGILDITALAPTAFLEGFVLFGISAILFFLLLFPRRACLFWSQEGGEERVVVFEVDPWNSRHVVLIGWKFFDDGFEGAFRIFEHDKGSSWFGSEGRCLGLGKLLSRENVSLLDFVQPLEELIDVNQLLPKFFGNDEDIVGGICGMLLHTGKDDQAFSSLSSRGLRQTVVGLVEKKGRNGGRLTVEFVGVAIGDDMTDCFSIEELFHFATQAHQYP
jgi:hypothetical protein